MVPWDGSDQEASPAGPRKPGSAQASRTMVRETRVQGREDISLGLATHLCGFGQAGYLKSTSQDSWEEPRLVKHSVQGPQGGHGRPISHLPAEPAEPRAGALVQAVVGELGWWRGTGGHRPRAGCPLPAGQQCGQRLQMTESPVFASEMPRLSTSLRVATSHCWWPIYNQGHLGRELARPWRAH